MLAVPVASPRAMSDLEALVDEVVCLERPSAFRAVGQYYEQFEQVSDEAAMSNSPRSDRTARFTIPAGRSRFLTRRWRCSRCLI